MIVFDVGPMRMQRRTGFARFRETVPALTRL
jgi:hypothetical protein